LQIDPICIHLQKRPQRHPSTHRLNSTLSQELPRQPQYLTSKDRESFKMTFNNKIYSLMFNPLQKSNLVSINQIIWEVLICSLDSRKDGEEKKWRSTRAKLRRPRCFSMILRSFKKRSFFQSPLGLGNHRKSSMMNQAKNSILKITRCLASNQSELVCRWKSARKCRARPKYC
jgi:hypothetical protein